jgi:cytochrome c5
MGSGAAVVDMSKNKTAVHEDHSHDRAFVVTFLGVLAVLIGIAVAIGFVANHLVADDQPNPIIVQKTAERLAPIASVYTDASQVPVVAKPAAVKEQSAEEIVQTVCAACHASGILNAPKIGDVAVWKVRLKATGGLSGLVMSAINGKGSMPARGGGAELTDEQIKAAVKLMLK